MFAAVLDTSVLCPSLQRDFLLSLAAEILKLLANRYEMHSIIPLVKPDLAIWDLIECGPGNKGPGCVIGYPG